AERWNGGTNTWTIEPTVDPAGAQASSLAGVSCTSATACTAVGFYFSSSGSDLPLAERYTGTWGLQAGLQAPPNPAGATASFLAGVSCTSATACTAVGHYNNSSGTSVTLAEGWNGNTNSWTVQSTPNPGGGTSRTLVGVPCPPARSCTAVGADGH